MRSTSPRGKPHEDRLSATSSRTALATRQVAANRLIIEITETALLPRSGRKRPAPSPSSISWGISISIDDFGQGHTSLGHLPTLPIDELKIDQQFVTDMLEQRAERRDSSGR